MLSCTSCSAVQATKRGNHSFGDCLLSCNFSIKEAGGNPGLKPNRCVLSFPITNHRVSEKADGAEIIRVTFPTTVILRESDKGNAHTLPVHCPFNEHLSAPLTPSTPLPVPHVLLGYLKLLIKAPQIQRGYQLECPQGLRQLRWIIS